MGVKGSSKLALIHLGLSVTSCAFLSQHRFSVKDSSDGLQAPLGLSVPPHVQVWASVSEQGIAALEVFGQTAWPAPTHPPTELREAAWPQRYLLGVS